MKNAYENIIAMESIVMSPINCNTKLFLEKNLKKSDEQSWNARSRTNKQTKTTTKNKTLLQEFCVPLSHSWPELGFNLAMKNRKAWN